MGVVRLAEPMQDRTPKQKAGEAGQDDVSVGRAGRKTAETLNATDRIVEALELAAKEAERLEVGSTLVDPPPRSPAWAECGPPNVHECTFVHGREAQPMSCCAPKN